MSLKTNKGTIRNVVVILSLILQLIISFYKDIKLVVLGTTFITCFLAYGRKMKKKLLSFIIVYFIIIFALVYCNIYDRIRNKIFKLESKSPLEIRYEPHNGTELLLKENIESENDCFVEDGFVYIGRYFTFESWIFEITMMETYVGKIKRRTINNDKNKNNVISIEPDKNLIERVIKTLGECKNLRMYVLFINTAKEIDKAHFLYYENNKFVYLLEDMISETNKKVKSRLLEMYNLFLENNKSFYIPFLAAIEMKEEIENKDIYFLNIKEWDQNKKALYIFTKYIQNFELNNIIFSPKENMIVKYKSLLI